MAPSRRVVVTGVGVVSPFGKGAETLFSCLSEGKSAVIPMPELAEIDGVDTGVAGVIRDIDFAVIPRKIRRSMSKMSMYTYLAVEEALEQAGLFGADLSDGVLTDGHAGVSIGSTLGSSETFEEFFRYYLPSKSISEIKAMTFFRIMGHSVAANIAQAFGITGRVLAPAAACSSGSQAIGLGFEAIANSVQDIMICGGADEYHPLTSATFDKILAASRGFNDTPHKTPRPFDSTRDGVVCAEGAGILLLEAYDSAVARNAHILAEILGFASCSDPSSIASPDPMPVFTTMKKALANASVDPECVSYVNAHATGTVQGDMAEAKAIAMLIGDAAPVSSLKGHLGHTMAASGAIETVASIMMMKHNIVLPTLNLKTPAEECQGIQHVFVQRHHKMDCVLKNNFALGGINCSLVLRKI